MQGMPAIQSSWVWSRNCNEKLIATGRPIGYSDNRKGKVARPADGFVKSIATVRGATRRVVGNEVAQGVVRVVLTR
jgi:hypothetical protein